MTVLTKEVEERAQRDIEEGERKYEKLAPKIETSNIGAFVVINLETNEYLIGSDEIRLINLFNERFGRQTRRFYRKIGGPYPHVGFFG